MPTGCPSQGDPGSDPAPTMGAMQRPTKFEHYRWIGDKRSQVVYDVDNIDDPTLIEELMAAETFIGFGPDELAEARNRGYKPYKGNGSGVESGE
jgi:hypothetical protein